MLISVFSDVVVQQFPESHMCFKKAFVQAKKKKIPQAVYSATAHPYMQLLGEIFK